MAHRIVILLSGLLVALSACSAAQTPVVHDVNLSETQPDWLTLTLTDARTGTPFTLADYADKTVYVQPMATWCTNCRRQMHTLVELNAALNRTDIVFVGISVENALEPKVLAEYVDEQGFDWVFAVAPPELAEAWVVQFGNSVLNPPTTPHFVIAPNGTVSQLFTGYEDVAALTGLLTGVAGSS